MVFRTAQVGHFLRGPREVFGLCTFQLLLVLRHRRRGPLRLQCWLFSRLAGWFPGLLAASVGLVVGFLRFAARAARAFFLGQTLTTEDRW